MTSVVDYLTILLLQWTYLLATYASKFRQ